MLWLHLGGFLRPSGRSPHQHIHTTPSADKMSRVSYYFHESFLDACLVYMSQRDAFDGSVYKQKVLLVCRASLPDTKSLCVLFLEKCTLATALPVCAIFRCPVVCLMQHSTESSPSPKHCTENTCVVCAMLVMILGKTVCVQTDGDS